MLFAAGFGTRMGGLTTTCPKPLIKVSGAPLIDHALEIINAANITNTVVNTHYLPRMLTDHLADRNVLVSHEHDILETGGGLRHALPMLGSNPVFTLNSDAVWTGQNPLNTLAAAWNPDLMDALLLLISPDNTQKDPTKGDFDINKNGTITRGTGFIYSGAQIIKTEMLKDISETCFSLNLLWDMIIKNGRAFGTVHNGNWCDVGTPQGIINAEEMLEDNNV
jgi:MurNAc alpha-1-phosphate uridylyltransferase